MLFDCPHCRNKIRIVRDQKSGGSVKCPKCGSDSASWETDTATLRVIPKTIGKYELRIRLGQGQFGEVWSAHDPDLDRLIAIKIPRNEDLDAFDVERFVREARAAAQLQHPNIVKLLEFGEDPIYIASELIDGASLADRLAAGLRPTWQETATLCMKLAKALQHAHERGVVHRDIKPANVLTDKSMEPFLSDFGLAKRDGGEITMTFDGQIIGTPAYMPPEQARGDGHNADARSDVYSLGVVLFEMLTGIRPFQGGTQVLIQQILYQDARPLRTINRSIPRDLETICLKCLEKAPQQRYQTAQLLAEELQRVLNCEPINARPISRIARWGRWANRNRRMAALLATCLLLFVSLGIVAADNMKQRYDDLPPVYDVTIKSYPNGATFVYTPIDPSSGELLKEKSIQPDGVTPLTIDLSPGDYWIEAREPGGATLGAYRHVPDLRQPTSVSVAPHHRWNVDVPGKKITLPILILRTAEQSTLVPMIAVDGGEMEFAPHPDQASSDRDFPPRQSAARVSVPTFQIATHELTRREAIAIFESAVSLPLDVQRDFWISEVPPEQRLANVKKQERYQGDLDEAVTMLDYDDALMIAELAGCRLPTEKEMVFSATNRGSTEFPWGDDPLGAQPDETQSPMGIRELLTGNREWTVTWPQPFPSEPQHKIQLDIPKYRVVKGVLMRNGGVTGREFKFKDESSNSMGVRFVRALGSFNESSQ